MSEVKTYPIIKSPQHKPHIDEEMYHRMYQQSIRDPDKFWGRMAHQFIDWFEPWDEVSNVDFKKAEISWFKGGKLNASYNCIDRHLKDKAEHTAIIWEGDEPDQQRYISYQELHDEVCQFANALKERGVKKGDRVCIYMPMIPEVGFAMLACARIGAVHSVVFGGFSPEALKSRILDSDCQVLITADASARGGKKVPLKANADIALKDCPDVHTVMVVKSQDYDISWNDERDVDYFELKKDMPKECKPEVMDAEDPLFILYTSGSTGKPKGVLHTTGGYLLYTSMTHKYVFDYHEGEIYWCTADAGWITGHSYIFYGPLANGATTLVFEGVPTYPSTSRFWEVIDKHKVSIFYTAPTAIRALMAGGNEAVTKCSRQSLRILGTVGEPINPEAWEWYYKIVGEERCPIIDTWWQTETGGILITPLPGATPLKPGSATRPFFGVEPALLDTDAKELDGVANGSLVMKNSWPGQMRSVWGDHQRFYDTYFSQFPGYYFSGDGAQRDSDGYYWITGRMDDVLNVSGHRMGTAEIESALVLHPKVAEAAVVGYPHDIKGQGIYVYVTLMKGQKGSDELKDELVAHVAKEIGPIAKPDKLQFADDLPKTRSGKIMRRILRKIAADDVEHIGDTSTLAEPAVVEKLIEEKL
ncbi:acetate--CoA ligase [Kangiella sediminilitoris]|uniref:Acetyl-coenzyme A synthetase n=1 Tax=Kangiella sediminilitoris TaxID=1144748 RepID=A0A1B3BD49_9GAMM|nr:acetate--CoA ligase [Kangiella sediminilitoris]AOE50764.1 Acetyl-coenzyme A synthetase [Kangiella sediminilitoris]